MSALAPPTSAKGMVETVVTPTNISRRLAAGNVLHQPAITGSQAPVNSRVGYGPGELLLRQCIPQTLSVSVGNAENNQVHRNRSPVAFCQSPRHGHYGDSNARGHGHSCCGKQCQVTSRCTRWRISSRSRARSLDCCCCIDHDSDGTHKIAIVQFIIE